VRDEVERLAEDSGALLAVAGSATPTGRLTMLRLDFEAGALEFRCDDDTDEIVVVVPDGDRPCSEITSGPLPGLMGLEIEYAWELRNHRGYVDGFQLRLRDSGGGREETVQFEVGASAIDVRRVT
jgi:Family of unknown function (DUF6334)